MESLKNSLHSLHSLRFVKRMCIPFKVDLTELDKTDIRKAINLLIIGDENVNIYDKKTNKIIPKYSEEIEAKVTESHRNINACRSLYLSFDILEDGSMNNFFVSKRYVFPKGEHTWYRPINTALLIHCKVLKTNYSENPTCLLDEPVGFFVPNSELFFNDCEAISYFECCSDSFKNRNMICSLKDWRKKQLKDLKDKSYTLEKKRYLYDWINLYKHI